MNPITDFLWGINAEVAKLSNVGLSRVEEVLDAAEKELTHDLAKWKALQKGDDRFTPQMYRNALVQIRGTLDHIRNSTDDGMASALKYGGVAAAKLATSHLTKEVQTFSQKFEHSIRPVAFDSASVIAQGQKIMWPKFQNSAHRYAGQVGEDIRKQLAIGLVRGETLDQLTERLARLGGPKGYVYLRGRQGAPNAKAEVIAEGLFRRYRHWGERLARTEIVNAYNETAMVGMDELEKHDPGYYRRWDAAIDGRTCPNCKYYDDLVVPLDKNFPGNVDHPPLHPNCRCAVVVWRKEWNESGFKDDLVKEASQGREPKGVASIPHVIHTPEPQKKDKPKPPKPVLQDEPKPKKPKKPKAESIPAPNPDLKPISITNFSSWQDKYAEKLSQPEKAACLEYGGSGYRDMNGYLRKKKGQMPSGNASLDKYIHDLDSALKKSVAEDSMMVYRGTRTDIVGKLKPGKILTDHGYMSTTCDRSVTETFRGNKGCLFHIEVPKGAHIGPIPTGLDEKELLLPRGTKLQILEIRGMEYTRPDGSKYTLDNGMKVVKCRVIHE